MKRPAPEPELEPQSESPEEIRARLCARLGDLLEHWRDCKMPVCHRTRRCAHPEHHCLQRSPSRPLSPQEQVEVSADFLRALKRRQAELGAESENVLTESKRPGKSPGRSALPRRE
jgi:hypothetical protein